MAQDTRKDPRAKVLTMTVRYKSATLDEFIEHHSYDISRGGMFIKTPSPFPPGTLLKFEVKIAEDQKLMQGVGRVVWKREPPDVGTDRPAGMGVKFIKIDEQSKKLIDQLVGSRGEGKAAFEQGDVAVSGAPPASKAPAFEAAVEQAAAARPVTMRKATMIGLGAMAQAGAEGTGRASQPSPTDSGAFFPKTEAEKDMPAPEDRTVMKQAAELLEDALREAGGSLEEVGQPAPAGFQGAPPLDEELTPATPAVSSTRGPEYAEPERAEPERAARQPSPLPEPEPRRPAPVPEVDRHVSTERTRRAPMPQPAPVSERPPRIAPSIPEESGGGGGKAIALLVGVAAAAGLVFFLTREKPTPPQPEAAAPPPAAESVAPPASAAATAEPAATAPAASASAAPAEAIDAGAPSMAAQDAGVGPAKVVPEKPAEQPKPAVSPKPVAKPKPAPAEPAAKPAAPAGEAPAEAPPKPKPKPKPAPKPADESDNPY